MNPQVAVKCPSPIPSLASGFPPSPSLIVYPSTPPLWWFEREWSPQVHGFEYLITWKWYYLNRSGGESLSGVATGVPGFKSLSGYWELTQEIGTG